MSFSQVSGIFFTYVPVPDIPRDRWDRCFPVYSGRYYLPIDKVSAHATVLSTSTHLTLKQTFTNSSSAFSIKNAKYSFPLYPHSSVVSFTCHVGSKTIKGVVQPKAKAKEIYDDAVKAGKTAGLLSEATAEIFTTQIGNIPADTTVTVEIGVIAELRQDAEKDTLRYTLPTSIAPKYGYTSADISGSGKAKEMDITVDIDMPEGISGVTAPNQAIALELGGAGTGGENSKATVKLAQKSSPLDADFVLQIKLKKFAKTLQPLALLEQHPHKPGHSAVMASLVPRINLPPPPASQKPEIIFLVDRSGSMYNKIEQLKSAMEIFLRSLPASGIKFNICSFGSTHSFMFPEGSRTYDQDRLQQALNYVSKMDSNMGGTELYRALEATLEKRFRDIENTEIFVLTDGEVWNTDTIFSLIKKERAKSQNGKGLRLFSLGIGDSVSYHLVEGMAKAGGGFSVFVGENERYEDKVVRMLKTALAARIYDVKVDVEYESGFLASEQLREKQPEKKNVEDVPAQQTLSLFDAEADSDDEKKTKITRDSRPKFKKDTNRFAHLKDITPPNPIQTPHEVTSIYSTQRLLIYLLFRPTQAPQSPKNVIIKAKLSTGADLNLKIPITRVSTYQSAAKSTMIHCLAARSIIKDLEDGKSWLESEDVGVTRQSNPGRFDEYVEREAEKLGMEFGVVSKWTSFVAVEKKDKEDDLRKEEDTKVGGTISDEKDENDDDYEVIPAPPYETATASQGQYQNAGLSTASRLSSANIVPFSAAPTARARTAGISIPASSISPPQPPPPSRPYDTYDPTIYSEDLASSLVQETDCAFSAGSGSVSRGGFFRKLKSAMPASRQSMSRASAPSIDNDFSDMSESSSAPSPPGRGGVLFGKASSARSSPHSMGVFGSASPSPAPPGRGGAFFGSASSSALFGGPPPHPPAPSRPVAPSGLFGSASPAPAPSGGGGALFGGPTLERSAAAPPPPTALYGAPQPSPAPLYAGVGLNDDEEEESATLPAKETDVIELISLQKFNGTFNLDENIIDGALRKPGFTRKALGSLGGETEASITALVIAVLKVLFEEKEGVWELVVDKALDWLMENGGEGLVAKAEALVKAH